jgi:hypothetical protein
MMADTTEHETLFDSKIVLGLTGDAFSRKVNDIASIMANRFSYIEWFRRKYIIQGGYYTTQKNFAYVYFSYFYGLKSKLFSSYLPYLQSASANNQLVMNTIKSMILDSKNGSKMDAAYSEAANLKLSDFVFFSMISLRSFDADYYDWKKYKSEKVEEIKQTTVKSLQETKKILTKAGLAIGAGFAAYKLVPLLIPVALYLLRSGRERRVV